MPQPTYKNLRRFCEVDGWTETKSARGTTPDHFRYRKVLPDGTILKTKVSHGNGSVEDPTLWSRIWKHQLGLTSEQDFWKALSSGDEVTRPSNHAPQPVPAQPVHLPRELFWLLVHNIGLSEQEAAALSKEEAVTRMNEHYSEAPPVPD